MRRRMLTTLALSAAVAGAGATATTPATGATPSGTFNAPRVAITMPSGCPITNYRLAETGDGIWHGFVLSACADHVDRVYYVQRNTDGQWLLRGMPFRFDSNTAFDVAADGQGTYLVAISQNYHPGRVDLIRRNNDGSLSALHTLSTSVDNPREVAVTASRGNYWVVWTNYSTTAPGAYPDTRLYESRTMGTPVARAPYHAQDMSPSLALRPGHGVALATQGNDGGGTAGQHGLSAVDTNDGAHGWHYANVLFGDAFGGASVVTAAGRVYAEWEGQCNTDDLFGGLPERLVIARETTPGGSFVKTELDPTGTPACAKGEPGVRGYGSAQVGSALWVFGEDSRDPQTLVVWKQAADGSFPATPVASYPKPAGFGGASVDHYVPVSMIGVGSRFAAVYPGTGDALAQRTLYEADATS